jgi:hypothetical protein
MTTRAPRHAEWRNTVIRLGSRITTRARADVPGFGSNCEHGTRVYSSVVWSQNHKKLGHTTSSSTPHTT